MLDTVKQLHDELRGQDVFIVAGGSSIRDINLSNIVDKKIIVVNNSYQLFDECTAIWWCDASWADNHYRGLENHSCKLRFHARKHAKLNNAIKGNYGCTILQKSGDFGFDPDPNSVRGNNGGTQVLNLVINMKPNRIFLLGYDMRLINNNSHWHNDHILPVSNDIYADFFIPSITSMANELKLRKNVPEIINCSPFSAVRCFKIDKIENYIGDAGNVNEH